MRVLRPWPGPGPTRHGRMPVGQRRTLGAPLRRRRARRAGAGGGRPRVFFRGNLAYSTHTSCRRPEPYIRHQMDPRVHTFVSVSAGLVRISPSRACYHRLTLVRDRPSTALHNRTGGERRQQADHSGAKHRHSHPPPAPRRVPDSALVTVAAGGATTTSLFEFAALGANVRGHRGVGDTCKRGRGKRVRRGLEDKSRLT